MKSNSDLEKEVYIDGEMVVHFHPGGRDGKALLGISPTNYDGGTALLTKAEVLDLIGELKWFYDRM